MKVQEALKNRSGNKCELCKSEKQLTVYYVPPSPIQSINNAIYICSNCFMQIEQPEKVIPNHWHCLSESMWSEISAVQVVAWRILYNLRTEGWPQDLLDIFYLDEETQKWAKELINQREKIVHKDSNGVVLKAGDTVVFIKDLNVKGSSLTAKRGVAVRNISLDNDNSTYIEGKVDGQQIVILTQFVKKV